MGKLLFDLTACQSDKSTMNHGGKEYGEAVFREMMRQGVNVSGFYNSLLEIDNSFLEYCRNRGELYDCQTISLQSVIENNDYSAFYSALPYSFDGIKWNNTVFIGNIHGLRPVEAFSDKYEYKYTNSFKELVKALVKRIPFVEASAKRSFLKRIGSILANPSFVCITGSEHSKYALLNYYPRISPNSIKVFYDPLDLEVADDSIDICKERYYLLVSGNRWLKNTYRGIVALDQLISSGRLSSKVVVTGTTPNMFYMKDIMNKDNFIFKGYVSSTELASLYKNAYCLVFLSLSEGFGYPPLEAISRGTPVVCSPLTALYEVYQDSVLYCNPFSIDDIKVKILEMEDEQIHNNYLQRGQNHSKEMISIQEKELPKLVEYISSFA